MMMMIYTNFVQNLESVLLKCLVKLKNWLWFFYYNVICNVCVAAALKNLR